MNDEHRHAHVLNQLRHELVATLTDTARTPTVRVRTRRTVSAFQQLLTQLIAEALGATSCSFEPVDPKKDADSPVSPFRDQREFPESIHVRVSTEDALYGALRVESGDGRQFNPDDLVLAQHAAHLLATAIEHDIAHRRLQHLALYDPLTGLPNRALVLDRLGHALQGVDRSGGMVGLLFIDLDLFKQVNDRLGHHAGDATLTSVAQRLRDALRPSDTVGRIGGDEFVVVCDAINGERDALLVAERVQHQLSTPIVAAGHQLSVTASIGVAVAGSGSDPEVLYRNADRAMYEAKNRGRNRVSRFNEPGLSAADPAPGR